METKFAIDGNSSFRIKRPLITTSGFVSEGDGTVRKHLDELNDLLGKRIFHHAAYEEPAEEATASPAEQSKKGASSRRVTIERVRIVPEVKALLTKPLSPKRVPPEGYEWATDSLLYELNTTEALPQNMTLAELIDLAPDLSALKYKFQNWLASSLLSLDYNAKTILDGYPAITDYLIASAYHVMGVRDIHGLRNFVLSNRSGVKNVASYAAVSAARTIIDTEQLKVPDYNKDGSAFVLKLKSAGLSLSSASFKSSVHALINDLVFNSDEAELIEQANIGKIPSEMKPLLIKYIQHSPVPITKDNVKFFLPLFISQIQGQVEIAEPTEVDVEESDRDFDVQFLEDEDTRLQISKSAVKCAAQLYYSMVLGDELDVFNVVNYFTHKFLVRGQIEIQDRRLRDDLQMYVFSNEFIDLKTNKVEDRTRPSEREMFYRQVFNQGNARMTEDFIANIEYPRLWKVLILESARYLERAQMSPNPDSYVSRQNIMQAVEDIQYNLSTHCTGMSNVITPLIYAELDFVIRRIFMNAEILRQVVPAGGTWWRVVEQLYIGMKKQRPKATVLYNKAKLGHSILRSIADYNPATFEDDRNFSEFLSNVDAFITTQSILQEALTDDLKKPDEEEEVEAPEMEAAPGSAAAIPEPAMAAAGKNATDEWDF